VLLLTRSTDAITEFPPNLEELRILYEIAASYPSSENDIEGIIHLLDYQVIVLPSSCDADALYIDKFQDSGMVGSV
jgi:hypothetical protein